jgi:hypothetical protein
MHWLILLGLWILIGSIFVVALSDAIPTRMRRRRAWKDFIHALEQNDPYAAYAAALRTEHPTMVGWAALSQSLTDPDANDS